MVFVFFGQTKYLEQYKLCAETIPLSWNTKVITDLHFENSCRMGECIQVPTPTTVYDMLTFRKRIPEFVDINKYDRIWYSDPDILFTGDILKKYENNDNILLAYEPQCTIMHPCMSGGFDIIELHDMEKKRVSCINGGFWSIPKSKYEFFTQYKTLCDFFSSKWPNDMSTDQHVLNNLYHRGIIEAELFDAKDVVFRPNETGQPFGLVNHYIGMHSDKIEVMKSELKRMQ